MGHTAVAPAWPKGRRRSNRGSIDAGRALQTQESKPNRMRAPIVNGVQVRWQMWSGDPLTTSTLKLVPEEVPSWLFWTCMGGGRLTQTWVG